MTALKNTAGREKRVRPRGYIAEYKPQSKTLALLAEVEAVLEEYRDYLPMTPRQIAQILDNAIRDCLDLHRLEGDRAAEDVERRRVTQLLLPGANNG